MSAFPPVLPCCWRCSPPPAAAETPDVGVAAADTATASPSGFAEAGLKDAWQAEAEAAAAASGARVVGREVTGPGGWPRQVALMVARQEPGPLRSSAAAR